MPSFQELTNAAAGRDPAASSAAFLSLMRLVVTDPTSYLHKSFSFFTLHIDPSHIPTSLYGRITPVIETDVERALHSLKGISLIGTVYRDDRHIIDSLVHLWEDIWTWLRFLHTFCIDEDRAVMSKRISVFTIVSNVHHTYSSHERLRATTEYARGYLEMIVQQWALQIRVHDFVSSPSIYPLASVLAAYTNPTGTTIPATTVRVIAALGGSPDDVARLCLEHLHKTSELAHAQHSMALAAGADIELMTNFRVSTPIRYSLLGRHSIRSVTNILHSCSSLPYSSDTRESASFYLNSCSRFIGYALEFSNGFNAITEALDAQLLPALLRCGPWLANMNSSMTTQFLLPLTAILPKYLLYPTVLKVVSRALRRVRSLGVESRIAQPSPLWDAWKRFKALAEERINSLLQSGDTQDKYQMCHLPSCRKIDSADSFLVCQGCHEVWYCSELCQESGRTAHRNGCRESQARRKEGKPSPMSSRDSQFAGKLVQTELNNQFSEIMSAWRSLRTTVPVVEMDFTVFPMKMSVGSTALRPPDYDTDRKERAAWDDLVSRAEREGAGILRYDIPEGEYRKVGWSLIPLSSR